MWQIIEAFASLIDMLVFWYIRTTFLRDLLQSYDAAYRWRGQRRGEHPKCRHVVQPFFFFPHLYEMRWFGENDDHGIETIWIKNRIGFIYMPLAKAVLIQSGGLAARYRESRTIWSLTPGVERKQVSKMSNSICRLFNPTNRVRPLNLPTQWVQLLRLTPRDQ